MKTTVFITRRGRSFATAKVNPTSAFSGESSSKRDFSARRGRSFASAKVNPTSAFSGGSSSKRDFSARRGRSFATAKVNPTSAFSGLVMGEFQSGQMGQTVNLLSFDFGGSNPSSPTKQVSEAGKPGSAVLSGTTLYYIRIGRRATS